MNPTGMIVMENPAQYAVDERLKYLGGFTDYLLNENCSEKTPPAYCSDLRDFFAFCKKPLSGDGQFDDRDVDAFITVKRQAGLKPKTIQRRLAALSSFCHYLRKIRVRVDNPVDLASKPECNRTLPEVPTVAEVEAMCAVPGAPGAVVTILYGTAMRRAELAGALRQNHDPFQGSVRIVGKGGKERLATTTPPAEKRLAEFATVESRWLICWPDGSPYSVYDVYDAVLEARRLAGLARHIKPHSLRHACATHMTANGAPIQAVQEKLGHSSIQTTTLYSQIALSQRQAADRQFHPAFRQAEGRA